MTHTYGFSPVDGCYIPAYEKNNTVELTVSVAERFALLHAPAMVILLVASIAMIIMLIKLSYRVCWRKKYEPITGGEHDQFREALKQLLPLAAFPIIFLIFIIPVLVYDIFYSFLTPIPNRALVLAESIFITFWSLSSGVTLIVHICLAQLPAYCRKSQNSLSGTFESHVNSATNFSLPTGSIATVV